MKSIETIEKSSWINTREADILQSNSRSREDRFRMDKIPTPFRFQRRYQGPIEAVLLDWAGTTMDHGCMAPAVVFVEVFRRKEVPISVDEARVPMGAHKRVHIQRITEIPAVRERWTKVHGRPPGDADVEEMFQAFIPLQLACLGEYSELIPGAPDAARQGYVPDSTVCANEVPAGRPFPHMCLQNAINLAVTSIYSCVKIDDTVPGVEEGLNAGMWSIGLAMSGNEIGLPLKEMLALPKAELAAKRERAYTRMYQVGAHYVVDSIADVMPILDDIEARLKRGEKP
jgi:phosphonoacetaldehyde hydrolase